VALVALEIPKIGLVMENARLVRWLKNVGDVVKEGEPLLELETEKSIVEIESTHNGRLVEILLHVDQEARVGDRIGWLDSDTQSTPAAPSAHASGSGRAPASATASAPATAPQSAAGAAMASAPASAPQSAAGAAIASAPASPPQWAAAAASPLRSAATLASAPPSPSRAASASGRIKSSPLARRVAAEHAVDLRRITGTGPRGRVQLIDVRRAIETPSAGPQPLSSMRRALARSMTLSNATVPQFTVERAVDWTALHAQRAKVCAELPTGAPRPSVNDFLLQAIARSLLSFPALNATFSGDPNSPDACIVPANGAHIGLVVAVENGLLVPVFHGVEQFGLAELARLRSETVERALHGKLKREELEGATFSLSNLGARGPDRFNAIINPPQSAILAVGRQRDGIVIVSGAIHVRPISQLTLTVDHRVADGRLAADFLAYLVEILEGDAWRAK
jgi:pyruvate dehydrogenase E2 component (dihydrolipoamide acetyltransferase)